MKYYLSLFIILLSFSITYAQLGPKTHLSGCLSCGAGAGEPYDVDNDGDQDILINSEADGKLAWYENDGNGNFDNQHLIHQFTEDENNYVGLVDLDGDGFKDILFNPTAQVAYYFKHDGIDNFTTTIPLPGLSPAADMVYFEDMDNDGDLDISFRKVGTDYVGILSNDGTGSFTEVELSTDGINIRTLDAADADADGDMDLVMSTNPSGTLKWFEQLNGGTFANIADLTPVTERKDELIPVDLNGDGLIDFAFFHGYDKHIGYLLNQGGGVFSDEVTLNDSLSIFGLMADDLDQDGDQDLIAHSFTSGGVILFENFGNGIFADWSLLISGSQGSYFIATADFNQDQITDILSYSAGDGGSLGWFSGQPNLTFLENRITYAFQQGISSVRALDWDNDNDEDLFVTNLFGDNSGVVYVNNGNGDFTDTIDVSAAFAGLDVGLRLGGLTDFDGDGDIDIMPNNNSSLAMIWVENMGNNTFTQHQIGTETSYNYGYFVDLNGDGLEDIINYSTVVGNVWYENLGNGAVGPMTSLAASSLWTHRFITEDFEGDGDLDVFLFVSGEFYLLENDGSANFSPTLLVDNFEFVKEFAITDWDEDGLKDIVCLRGNSNFDQAKHLDFIKNEGSNNWSSPVEIHSGTIELRHLRLEDIDKDGDRDLFLITGYTFFPPISIGWVENFGMDGFSSFQYLETGVMQSRSFAFLDIDNDGYKELIQGEEYRLQYYENLVGKPTISGQLYWDENENKIQDLGEIGISGLSVSISPDPISSYSDDQGVFRFYVEEGAYTIDLDTASLGCWALTTDSVSYDVSVVSGLPVNLEFGLNSTGSDKYFTPGVTSGPTRCGFTVPFWLSVENTGCSNGESRYAVVLDPGVTFLNATVPPAMISGDTLFWESASLIPMQIEQVKMYLEMPGFQAAGSIIQLNALAYAKDSSGNYEWSNTYEFYSFISCAIDPNDKQVHPSQEGSEDNYALFTDKLTYTIRFQNTGTDTAFNIVITDTLDVQLDWATFQPLNSSHHFEATINQDNGAVEFKFPNVLLPDSNTNEVLSHGFVRFRILANEGIENNTVITNTAHIYFDFNPAVVTNTIQSTLVDKYIALAEIQAPLCHGDANGFIQASFPFISEVNYLWSNNETNPFLENLAAGDYGLSITDNDGQLLVDTFFTITDPQIISLVLNSTPEIDGNNNGTAMATVTGGTAPYTYLWNTNPAQTTAAAIDLSAGNYTVTITDANGCTIEETASVGETTDIDWFNTLSLFVIVPNPSQEGSVAWVKLQFSAPTDWHLELSNSLGQQLAYYDGDPSATVNAAVEIQGLNSGIYFLTLFTNGKVVRTKRLVIIE